MLVKVLASFVYMGGNRIIPGRFEQLFVYAVSLIYIEKVAFVVPVFQIFV